MSRIDPKLRELFEALPIDVKNQILESDIDLHSEQELRLCVEHIKQRRSCCGDL